jgi:glycosyltransferase involved in cell wall biosynthesis
VRRRRLALLLPQLPQDPASGAARNLRCAAEVLASGGGYDVACLGTTATERARRAEPIGFLHESGVDVRVAAPPLPGGPPVLRFEAGGVAYRLLDVGDRSPGEWDAAREAALDAAWAKLLSDFEPHVVLTYGARPGDVRRHRAAQARGARVVFSLQNLAYARPRGLLNHVDAVVTCSRFVSDYYARHADLASTPLPTPILPAEVIAPDHQPLMVTFVNPAVEKGLMFFVRLAEELCRRRADVPVLVVEGRGTSEDVIGAAQMGGFDLRRHRNLLIAPPVAHPREIYAAARVVLVPSVWAEPAGRVAVEAMVNGIPPIVSDRGGLPEVCAGGGIVLPLPERLVLETPSPIFAAEVEPWLEQVVRLCDDEDAYAAACASAREAGRAYLPPAVNETYRRFFDALI